MQNLKKQRKDKQQSGPQSGGPQYKKGEIVMNATTCKCEECGNVFDMDDARIEEVWESRGEFWGMPCREKMVYVYCPECGEEIY